MFELWDDYKKINEELKKDFLCIPPYACVTGKFIGELVQNLKNGQVNSPKIFGAINSPWQRAYQIEYRYKKCRIFEPFIKIIEYATYDAMNGNFICSYLSLLPVVEAVLRKWSDEEPELSFERIKELKPKLETFLKANEFYPDDRVNITDGYVDYLKYILFDVLFLRFKEYEDKNFKTIFNRNLTLHKLEGTDFEETVASKTQILLVLDIIAELYLMQDLQKYWENIFYANPKENIDFQLHFNLYIHIIAKVFGTNDINAVNFMLEEKSLSKKQEALSFLKAKNDIVWKKVGDKEYGES